MSAGAQHKVQQAVIPLLIRFSFCSTDYIPVKASGTVGYACPESGWQMLLLRDRRRAFSTQFSGISRTGIITEGSEVLPVSVCTVFKVEACTKAMHLKVHSFGMVVLEVLTGAPSGSKPPQAS